MHAFTILTHVQVGNLAGAAAALQQGRADGVLWEIGSAQQVKLVRSKHVIKHVIKPVIKHVIWERCKRRVAARPLD